MVKVILEEGHVKHEGPVPSCICELMTVDGANESVATVAFGAVAVRSGYPARDKA